VPDKSRSSDSHAWALCPAESGGDVVTEVVKDAGVSILERLRTTVSPECFQTWFRNLGVREARDGTVCMTVPNRFVRQWLEKHYRKELLQAAQAALPQVQKVELTVASLPVDEPAVALGTILVEGVQPEFAALNRQRPHSANDGGGHREIASPFPLSPKFRLENFVVGPANRLAFAGAQSVAESPGEIYNPLFLHGAHGLGKTHLLQGLAHLLQEHNPPLKVIYISCEEFTNAYVSAVQSKRLDAFRARFRTCDALLVDDVQFLAGRERTQEEFLHTFDALRQARKQIVVSADAAPRDIKGLDPKLVTRFQSELVARLDTPALALRVQLLRQAAQAREFPLTQDVAELIATHVNNNVRELEGAICKLKALSLAHSVDSIRSPLALSDDRERRLPSQTPSATASSPALPENLGPNSLHPPEGMARGEGRTSSDHCRQLALIALRELGYLRSGPVMPSDILEAVSEHYEVRPDDVRSGKRHAGLVQARHVGMYLAKHLTAQSLSDIGRFFGNRNHATVLHGCNKISEWLKRDERLQHDVQMLKQVLGRL